MLGQVQNLKTELPAVAELWSANGPLFMLLCAPQRREEWRSLRAGAAMSAIALPNPTSKTAAYARKTTPASSSSANSS